MSIRRATRADAPVLLQMIQELAHYERMPECVILTSERLAADLDKEAVGGFVVEEEDGEVVAMLLYYLPYSTWTGQFIHVEDIYVRPAHRRRGYGRRLWREAAKLAHDRGYARFQWDVLDWNEPALNFYNKFAGAVNLTSKEGWLKYRMDADAIKELAEEKTL